VDVELAPVGEQEGGEGGHGLGRRVDVDQGVGLPGPGPGRIGEAAPDVDHERPVHRGGQGGADIEAVLQVAGEGLADAFETGITGPLHVHSHDISPLAASKAAFPAQV
jgi:hypothetical protein